MTTILVVGSAVISLLAVLETRTNRRCPDFSRSHLLLWGMAGTLLFAAMVATYLDLAFSPSRKMQAESRAVCVDGSLDDVVRASLGPLQGKQVYQCRAARKALDS
jgi:hypothetical protein